jgi:AcrR family transcriptional regulator
MLKKTREGEVMMADNTARRLESDMSGPSGRSHDIPSPSWRRPPDRAARSSRKREPISHTTIVNGAIELLDRDGLDALSMRRLAEELSIGAASLYWHVGSKDGLLDLVLDQVTGETKIPEPDPDRWQDQLKDVARAQRAISVRHPWVVRVSAGRIPMGPNSLRHSEHVLAILRAAGFPSHVAVQGYLLLVSAVNGFTIDETGLDDSPNVIDLPRDGESRQHAAEMARDYFAALPPSQFPYMTALADEFALADLDERFELLIDTFVDGLARHVVKP